MTSKRTLLLLSAVFMLSQFSIISALASTWEVTPAGSGSKSLQSVVNNNALAGDTIILNPGIYATTPLTISKKLTLIGASSQVIIQGSVSDGSLFTVAPGGSGTTISGLTFQPGSGNTINHAIAAQGAVTDLTISNVIVQNFKDSGIYLNGGQRVTITDLEAVDNGGAGLYLVDVQGISMTNINTSGNAKGGIGVQATYSSACNGIAIKGNNYFGESGFGTCGMYFESPTGTEITYSDVAMDTNVTLQSKDFSYLSPLITENGKVTQKFFATAADAISSLGSSAIPQPLKGEQTYYDFLKAQGLKGDPGVKGDTGDKGDKGDTGDKGDPGLPGASPFVLAGNNAYYSAGNVGIGTATPAYPLDIMGQVWIAQSGIAGLAIKNNAASFGNVVVAGGIGNPTFVANWTPTGVQDDPAKPSWSIVPQVSNDQLVFQRAPAGSNTLATQMVIKGTGNVGVGTTAPSQKLEVNGGVRINTVTSKPVCDTTSRGTFWVTQGTSDMVEICVNVNGTPGWKTVTFGN